MKTHNIRLRAEHGSAAAAEKRTIKGEKLPAAAAAGGNQQQ